MTEPLQPPNPPSQPPSPKPKKKLAKWLSIAVAAIVVIAIGSAINANKNNKASNAGETTASQSAQPATATSAAPAPTFTPAPPPPPAPTALPPVSGSGDDVIPIGSPGFSAITFTNTGSSNFAVKADDGQLLVNEIGNYSGTVVVNLQNGQNATMLQITSDGNWTMTVIPAAAIPSKSGVVSGTGDDVFVYQQPKAPITLACPACKANFAVMAANVKTGSLDLLVNEIGAYTGKVFYDGPAVMVMTADSAWSVTPS